MRSCSIEGCDGIHRSRGWCRSHYEAWRRHGDPLELGNGHHGNPNKGFRWDRVRITPSCWEWTGTVTKSGYGVLSISGVRKRTHVLSYMEFVGPIPKGGQVDHRCRNRRCVNPDHLRLVTNKQNQENLPPESQRARSGYRGVYKNSRGKWYGQVKHNGVRYVTASVDDPHLAQEMVRDLRNDLFTHNDQDRR